MKILFEKYFNLLNSVRRDDTLWDNYRFNKNSKRKRDGKALQRLRIATALYNDLRAEDYEFTRFLFFEELKMKKRFKHHDVENLMLIGYLLAKFSKAEDTWMLFEAHNLDAEFELEFALMPGLPIEFYELDTVQDHKIHVLLKAIADTFPNSQYSRGHIERWKKKVENTYLKDFLFSEENAIHVAAVLEEKGFVRALLPDWKKKRRLQTEEEVMRYIIYAKDTDFEIEALELHVSLFSNNNSRIMKNILVEKYTKRKLYEKAIPLLCDILKREIEIDGIFLNELSTLCDILISLKGTPNPQVREALTFVRTLKTDKPFSPPAIASLDRLRKAYPFQF